MIFTRYLCTQILSDLNERHSYIYRDIYRPTSVLLFTHQLQVQSLDHQFHTKCRLEVLTPQRQNMPFI